MKHINLYYYQRNMLGELVENLVPMPYKNMVVERPEQLVHYYNEYCGFNVQPSYERILKLCDVPYTKTDLMGTSVDCTEENWFIISPTGVVQDGLAKSFVLHNCLYSLPHYVVDRIRSTGVKIIIWHPEEVANIAQLDMKNPNGRVGFAIAEALKYHQLDPQKIFFIDGNLRAQENWSLFLQNTIDPNAGRHYYDFNVFGMSYFEIVDTQRFSEEYVFDTTAILQKKDSIRSKKFICLNRNLKEQRVYVLAELMRRQCLDYGYYSLMDIHQVRDTFLSCANKKLADFYDSSLSQMDKEVRLSLYKELLQRVPIELDNKTEVLFKNDRILPISFIEDSYITLVNESAYYSNPKCPELFITEKTYKAIYWGHPFMVIGQPYILKYLRSLGYQTFPELFDESYDEELDYVKRIELVLTQMERICQMDNSELHNLYYAVFDKIVHNHRLFCTRHKREWLDKIVG